MILPVGATSFKEAMKMGSEVYHNLKASKMMHYDIDKVEFHSTYALINTSCSSNCIIVRSLNRLIRSYHFGFG